MLPVSRKDYWILLQNGSSRWVFLCPNIQILVPTSNNMKMGLVENWLEKDHYMKEMCEDLGIEFPKEKKVSYIA